MSINYIVKLWFRYGAEEKTKKELVKEEHFFHQMYRMSWFLLMTVFLTFLFMVL